MKTVFSNQSFSKVDSFCPKYVCGLHQKHGAWYLYASTLDKHFFPLSSIFVYCLFIYALNLPMIVYSGDHRISSFFPVDCSFSFLFRFQVLPHAFFSHVTFLLTSYSLETNPNTQFPLIFSLYSNSPHADTSSPRFTFLHHRSDVICLFVTFPYYNFPFTIYFFRFLY